VGKEARAPEMVVLTLLLTVVGMLFYAFVAVTLWSMMRTQEAIARELRAIRESLEARPVDFR
jgi:type IV secretory pathway VirB3-like protein